MSIKRFELQEVRQFNVDDTSLMLLNYKNRWKPYISLERLKGGIPKRKKFKEQERKENRYSVLM